MKKTNLAIAAIALALVGTGPVQAAGYVQSATIVEMAVNRAYGNVVFIKLSASPVDGAACSVLSWTFTLPLDGVAGREMYAILLSAAASGKQIRAAGTGQCSEHGQIESLLAVTLVI